MYKYVVFDFDGTLADSTRTALRAYNHLAEKHGFKLLAEEEIGHFQSLSIPERCRFLGVPPYKIPFLAGEFYGFYQESIKELTLYPGIRELLEALHQLGVKIAVISSNHENNIRNFLHQEGVDYIQEVICSHRIYSKDKMIKGFLKVKGLTTNEVIYVGDECRDIKACKKLKLAIIWVDWGLDLGKAAAVLEPDYMVNTPEQILEIIKTINLD